MDPRLAVDKIDRARGDNNCAFNAFILGLLNSQVLDQLEQQFFHDGLDINQVLATFIKAASNKLSVENTWAAIRKKLLALSKDNQQTALADIMRELAADLAIEDQENMRRMTHSLTTAFDEFARKKIGIAEFAAPDDIYSRHPFILKKFARSFEALQQQLKHEQCDVTYHDRSRVLRFNWQLFIRLHELEVRDETEKLAYDALVKMIEAAIEAQIKNLMQWWEEDAGYYTFQEQMRRSGEWAGDPELFQLAKYFHVKLNFRRDGFTYCIHHENGALPIDGGLDNYQLTASDISQLVVRGVVDKPEGNATVLQLLPLNIVELKQRLALVPEYKKVSAFVKDHRDALKGQTVSADWSDECVDELRKRDVVSNNKFVVDAETARARIGEMNKKAKLQAAWVANRKHAPTITLVHHKEGHWDSTITINQSNKAKSKAGAVTGLIEETLNLCHKKQVIYNHDDWLALKVKATKDLKRHPKNKHVTYFFGATTMQVSKKMQEKLDEQLAMRMQQEEYEKYLKNK